MAASFVAASICAAALFIHVNAETDAIAPSQSASSKVKVFLIAPEESDQDFMCESGQVQSVLATAIAEHRVVSIIFLDQSRAAIPEGVWSSAYGFRLAHRQTIKVQAAMICGN